MMFKLDSQKSFTSVYLAALQVWEEISSNSTGSELDRQIWTSTGLITMEEWVREGERESGEWEGGQVPLKCLIIQLPVSVGKLS